jgi:hypothetical protein
LRLVGQAGQTLHLGCVTHSHVALRKSLDISGPRFPHPSEGNQKSPCLPWLLSTAKPEEVEQALAHGALGFLLISQAILQIQPRASFPHNQREGLRIRSQGGLILEASQRNPFLPVLDSAPKCECTSPVPSLLACPHRLRDLCLSQNTMIVVLHHQDHATLSVSVIPPRWARGLPGTW